MAPVPPPQTVEGEQFVRGLTSHVKKNAQDIIVAAQAAAADPAEPNGIRSSLQTQEGPSLHGSDTLLKGDTSVSSDSKSSGSGTFASLMSAVGWRGASPSAAGSTAAEASASTSTSSGLVLDPYHLAYLGSLFRTCPLVHAHLSGDHDAGGRTSPFVAPVVAPTPDLGKAAPSGAFSLSFIWGGSTQTSDSSSTTLDEDIFFLYTFFERLPFLKLAPVSQRRIVGVDYALGPLISLAPFSSLVGIELFEVHPSTIVDWALVRTRLTTLVCRKAIRDVGELIEALEDAHTEEDDIVMPGSKARRRKMSTSAPADNYKDVAVRLPSLSRLVLTQNELNVLPEMAVSHFPQCTQLDLSHNGFDAVPPSLSALVQLAVLDLGHNKIGTLSGAEDMLRNVSVLSLRSNGLENLMGVESLVALRMLDVRDNKIWDVFEIGRLAALQAIEEIVLAGNPLTNLKNYRTNIFTYFKALAFDLSLDGTTPTPAEKKAIRANLTVAAPSTKPTTGQTDPIAKPTSAPSSNGDDKTEIQSSRSASKSDGPRKKKGKAKTKEKSARPLDGDVRRGSLGSLGSDEGRRAGEVLAAGSSSDLSRPRASKTFRKASIVPSPDSATSSSAQIAVATPKKKSSIVVPPAALTPPVTSAPSSSATSPEPSFTAPSSTSPTAPKRVRRMAEIERTLTEASLVSEDGEAPIPAMDSADLLVSRAGKRGTKIRSGEKEKKEKEKKRAKDRSPKEAPTPTTPDSLSPSPSPATTSPLAAALGPPSDSDPPDSEWGERYRRRIEALKIEAGGDWVKVYSAMQEEERRKRLEKEAATAREAAREAAVAKEAADAKEVVEKERTEGLSVGSDAVGEYADADIIVEKDVVPPTEAFARGTSGPRHRPSPAPTVGNHIGNIGPYRRIYDLGSRTGSSDSVASGSGITSVKFVSTSSGDRSDSAKPIHVSFSKPPAQNPTPVLSRKSSGLDIESGSSADFTGVNVGNTIRRGLNARGLPPLKFTGTPAPLTSSAPMATPPLPNTTASSSTSPAKAPSLVLSRPLASNVSYTRSRTGSISTHSDTSRSVTGVSLYSAPTARARVIYAPGSAMGGGSRLGSTIASTSAAHATAAQIAAQVPRGPSIPFMAMNNSLQLHLKFRVFNSDEEKILCWIPGSYVSQLPPYVADLHGQSGAGGGPAAWFARAGSKFAASSDLSPSAAVELASGGPPAERPVYMMLSDHALYLFAPTFPFPYMPKDGGADPYAQYIAQAMLQIRYDDPSKFLSLLYAVPFSRIARVDVGPNGQYVGLHFLKGVDGSGPGASGSGIGSPLLTSSASVGLRAGGRGLGSPFVSLVVLTRDRAATTRFVDGLEAVAPGAALLLHRDVSWAARGIADRALLRRGPKDIEFNWAGPVWAVREPAGRRGSSSSSSGGRGRSAVRGLGRKLSSAWLDMLMGIAGSEDSPPPPPPAGPASPPALSPAASDESLNPVPTIIEDSDEDPLALSSPLPPPTATSPIGDLYLLVGWVLPYPAFSSSTSRRPSPSATVRPLTLLGTSTYLYLLTERFDAWPPLLFPPESSLTAEKANARVERLAPRLGARYGGKGLVADAVGQVGGVVRCARVKDVVRCERWRTWRWGVDAARGTDASGTATPTASALGGGWIQNGAVGAGGERDGSGCAAGWGWWVRVGFGAVTPQSAAASSAVDETPAAPAQPPPTADATTTPHWWDLVFTTLDGANEFLEFVRNARGVKGSASDDGVPVIDEEEYEDEEVVEPPAEEPEWTEPPADLDARLLGKVRRDGVVFVIGDD
ncbi:hypothetical protein BDK51DRAFT_34053 [Blyttiomyces helicus]|uniref:Leucine rich repeat domain containing protein n=1 Tax=Blyttiomyces helicus TaxID=388810 RepID=A0A4P9WL43_9FUNG|nr:hypothetical protein BDK51DRAFT_34053 [Blyttiomyces helicus]|eukprot:RKO93564.1 hypothetical protein BDK51DRAFT_34053 [Blyttiomyces helicus]